ncbi:MAG: hypothetical protein ACOX7N_02505 [Lawsonibacter sp.]|jgi:hypothetical protein
MKKYRYHVMLVCAALGLLNLLVVILTGVAYPNLIFQVGTLLGLGFIFLALFLLALNWGMDLCYAVKTRQWKEIIFLLVVACILLFAFFLRR